MIYTENISLVIPELIKFKLMHDFSDFKIVIRFR